LLACSDYRRPTDIGATARHPAKRELPEDAATQESRKGPAVYADLISFSHLLSLALGLNDRSFALANRGLAFANASREAEGEEHRAQDN
jgi:hypothetical protein